MRTAAPATLAAITLLLLAIVPAQAGPDPAPGDDDDSAAVDEAAGDDDSAVDDDDSAAVDEATGDDDSAVDGGAATGAGAGLAEPKAAETVVRASLPWRVVPRAGLPPAADQGPGQHLLSRRDLEEGAGPLADPAHALQLLPGINSDHAANAWFLVRGGGRDELNIELDGIRVREFSHLTGIMSVVDSGLVRDLALYATAPPAHLGESLSGSLFLSYIDRPHDRFDGRLSLDALGLSAHVAVTLDKDRTHHLVIGGRQSFLTAYLGAARALGAWDGAATAADYGETFARYRYDASPSSVVRTTVLYSRDRVLLDDINLRHQVFGAATDWRWRYSQRGELHTTLSHSSNEASEPPADFSYPHRRSWHDREHRTMLRAVLSEQIGATGALRLGVEAAVTTLDVRGEFADKRTIPSWSYLPLAELDGEILQLSSGDTWPELLVSAASDLPAILGPLSLQLGLRASLLNRSGRPYASPRIGAVLPLPSGTTIRASAALQHQPRLDPIVVDRDLGNPELLPERALHVVLGVDQWFPAGLLIKAEGWFKGYDQLVVYAVSADGSGGSFVNAGTGRALGIETTVALRRGRVDLRASFSALRSTRSTSAGGPVSDATGDQRYGVDAQAAVLLGTRRRLKISGDYSYASGWPISSLQRVAGPAADTFSWRVTGINDRRLADQHRVSVAIEGSHPFRHWRLRGTVRLSVAPAGLGFTEDCPPLVDEQGNPPQCAPLQFLPPLMPWLGLQADW